MKVALVIPRDPPGANNFHQVPIGSLYTAGQLKNQNVDVNFYDLRVNGQYDKSIFSEIAESDLTVVFSTDYDLAQCYPSLSHTAECVKSIKESGNSLVACAGSHGTADAALTKKFTGADVVVKGEFEFAVPDLVRFLEKGGECPEAFPTDGVRLASEDELRLLGRPFYELAPMNRYFSEGFVGEQLNRVNSGLILANRGCPYGCNFCYLFFERKLRRRPVESTMTELKTMYKEHGFRHFFFLDYTFTIDNSWVRALCESILESGLDISWICQTRVDCLDKTTLNLMKDAGCSGIWLGIESPQIEQRRYLSKGRIGFESIEEGISLIRNSGIEVLVFVIVGVPNETEQSLANLNQWLDESQVYYSLSTFQRRLGTPLAKGWNPDFLQQNGWAYLDSKSEFLGESNLRYRDLDWFFVYHDQSLNRMANIMRLHLNSDLNQ